MNSGRVEPGDANEGSLAPFLQTSPVLGRVRPTKDVDAIIASASYSEFVRCQEDIRRRGFKQNSGHATAHIHRWEAPNSVLFDLVPVGSHLGATYSVLDEFALESAVRLDIAASADVGPQIVRHASAVAFMALKWGAFRDRGQVDRYASHDLEDLIALTASRPRLPSEFLAAPPDVRAIISEWVGALLSDPYVDELIDGHLGLRGPRATPVRDSVLAALRTIAAAG